MRSTPWPALDAFRDPDILSQEDAARRSLEDVLLDSEVQGLGLAAPARARLTDSNPVPALYCAVKDAIRAWEAPTKRNLVLLAESLDGPGFSAVKAFTDAKPKGPDVPPPRPTGDAAEAMSCGCRFLDLRALARLHGRPGRYAFTLLDRDWKSNTEIVEIQVPDRDPGRDVIPAPGKSLPGHWRASLSESHARGWVARLQAGPATASAMEVLAPALEAQVALEADSGAHPRGIRISGVANLIVGPHHLFDEGLEAALAADLQAAAVIAAPVRLIGSVRNPREALSFEAILPLPLPARPSPGDSLSFAFNFVLSDRPEWLSSSEEFWFFLLSGGAVAGPVHVEVPADG